MAYEIRSGADAGTLEVQKSYMCAVEPTSIRLLSFPMFSWAILVLRIGDGVVHHDINWDKAMYRRPLDQQLDSFDTGNRAASLWAYATLSYEDPVVICCVFCN